MLERLWLIVIFVLSGLLPPVYAARTGGGPEELSACTMACCAGGCQCEQCPCAGGDDRPVPDEPAVPVQPEREQKRAAEGGVSFVDVIGEVGPRPTIGVTARSASVARWPVVDRLESVVCVWRI